MYKISQFKPTLYALLLLGILGFSLASESPGVWLLGTGGILLNAWLVRTGRFLPMPRILANVVTIGSMLFVAREAFTPNNTPVMVIGKFLVLLQLIKLWEQRANRDYAQLLVLSLLLMVAASINTASLLFGILLLVYLFLSLYCCLLFHLKVESDAAKLAFALPEGKMSPATLRQDERYLTRSMRRLAGFVSAVAIVAAVVVFLLFPRGAGAGMFGPMQFRPSQTLTGFSENVSFQQLARITQSTEEVARVTVYKNGVPVSGAETLLLRGVTLDRYNDQPTPTGAGRWQWTRVPTRDDEPGSGTMPIERGQSQQIGGEPSAEGDRYVQQVSLNPTGTKTLFAMAGPIRITVGRDLKLRYSGSDGVIQSDDPLTSKLDYEVVSTNQLPPDTRKEDVQRAIVARKRWEKPNPKIYQYASRPDVSGADDGGKPLAQSRPRDAYVTDLDGKIAEHIENHLRTAFTYTLDLTDAAKLKRDEDPMVAFLYDLKRGHCEYFAGAMALMCQSMGMQARVVNGFKCDEYSNIGHYYIVRQSHAHSWVEVLTADGWRTFDPTSSREEQRPETTVWQSVKHFFDFLEFTYANSVIAYDNDHRENLIANVEAKMTNSTYSPGQWLLKFQNWFDLNMYSVGSTAIGVAMVLMTLLLVGVVGWFLWERWMLRRRAARIGLDNLPPSDQMRLVRQLGFYDDLVRLLAKHHIVRPKHMTPLEFSQSLLFLPSQAYESVRRLTEIFYRVRFGESELSAGMQKRLDAVIGRLEACLGVPPARPRM
jgi:transglutaminase-like putative cysteine protease